MSVGKSILDLQDELKEMPEFKVLETIRHFSYSIDIFRGNFDQLRELLEFHNDPIKSQELHTVNNREILHAFHTEIARLLHNYVAAAFSLIDHTRKHYNQLYKSTQKFPDYQAEIEKRFIKDPLSNFIKELRQFVQHYKLPELYSQTKFRQNPPEFKRNLKLRIEDLRSFNWNSNSLTFLNNQLEDIDLLELTNSYFNTVHDFYAWFNDKQIEIHKDEIEIVESKKAEIRKFAFPDLIAASLSFPNNSISQFEAGIAAILNLKEQTEINSISDNTKRCVRLIKILSKHVQISEDLKNRMKALYSKN